MTHRADHLAMGEYSTLASSEHSHASSSLPAPSTPLHPVAKRQKRALAVSILNSTLALLEAGSSTTPTPKRAKVPSDHQHTLVTASSRAKARQALSQLVSQKPLSRSLNITYTTPAHAKCQAQQTTTNHPTAHGGFARVYRQDLDVSHLPDEYWDCFPGSEAAQQVMQRKAAAQQKRKVAAQQQQPVTQQQQQRPSVPGHVQALPAAVAYALHGQPLQPRHHQQPSLSQNKFQQQVQQQVQQVLQQPHHSALHQQQAYPAHIAQPYQQGQGQAVHAGHGPKQEPPHSVGGAPAAGGAVAAGSQAEQLRLLLQQHQQGQQQLQQQQHRIEQVCDDRDMQLFQALDMAARAAATHQQQAQQHQPQHQQQAQELLRQAQAHAASLRSARSDGGIGQAQGQGGPVGQQQQSRSSAAPASVLPAGASGVGSASAAAVGSDAAMFDAFEGEQVDDGEGEGEEEHSLPPPSPTWEDI